MASLISEKRYLLCSDYETGGLFPKPFGSASFAHEDAGISYFHNFAFHDFHRDAPADCFREGVAQVDWVEAFVNPHAPSLRGLMGLDATAGLGIDPGLEFPWKRDRVKPMPTMPTGHRMSESVVLSVP